MATSQHRLETTMARLDSVLDARLRREELAEAEEARAREAARRQKARDNAEERRVIAAAYSDAYASFGTQVPAPVDDEAPASYRRRLYNRLARRLPSGHELAEVRADDISGQQVVFDNFERMLLEAAKAEGMRPSEANLPPDGSLISRNRVDDATNARTVEWFGTESFIKSLGRPGRRVLRLCDPRDGRVLLGLPFRKQARAT